MLNSLKIQSFIAVFSLVLLTGFSASAQQSNEAVRQNAGYRKQQNVQAPATTGANTRKITSTLKMMKEADFSLYTFPMKNTAYLSVKSAMPNETVKVVVYDVAGKVIYNEKVPTGNYGEFVIQIDPRIDFVPGDCFIAATYNNQVFYETVLLDKF